VKTYQLMKSQKSALESVSNDASSLQASWTKEKTSGDNQSTIGSLIRDEEFGFDDPVTNSRAYRRVFVMQQNKHKLPDVLDADEEEEISAPSETRNSASTKSDATINGELSALP
jgi:hypothetical protein